LEAIKDAARKIEQAEGRLFHSFFWFRAGDSVDELALDSLAAGKIDEAIELWNKQLGKEGQKKYTWRLNRGVIRLLKANGTPGVRIVVASAESAVAQTGGGLS
jgi:hypothetical protein